MCTWNSYIQVVEGGKLLYPAGRMNTTEANLQRNNRIQMTVGCREVDGFHGIGTGFRITRTAAVLTSGPNFERIKQKFPWVRAAVEVTADSVKQLL